MQQCFTVAKNVENLLAVFLSFVSEKVLNVPRGGDGMDTKEKGGMIERRMAVVTTIGGTLRFFAGMGEKLLERGWSTWAIADRDDHYDAVCRAEGFYRCPIRLSRRIDPLADLRAIFSLWRSFRRLGIAHVHAHTPKAGMTAMIAAWLARVPVRTYTIHGLPIETSCGLRSVFLWIADAVALLCATNVYAVSLSVKTAMKRYRLPRASSVNVLGNGTVCGVDIRRRFRYLERDVTLRRQAVRARFNIPQDAVVAGFVGRFVRDKGVRELVNAWRLANSEGLDLYMLMVGALDRDGGPDLASIHAVQQHSQWAWAGWDPQVEIYYPAMDFLVLPSYREGFPTVVLEAAAMQRPSIVSNATGCIDAVIDDVTGQVVCVRDSASLAAAMVRYARDIPLCEEHGRSARAFASTHFAQVNVQKGLLNEYDRLHHQLAANLLGGNGLAGALDNIEISPRSGSTKAA